MFGFHKNKKSSLIPTLCGVVLSSGVAMAATVNVDVMVRFLGSLRLGSVVDMNFGVIEYSGTPTANDVIRMGTNGAITYGGGVFSGSGSGTAGRFDITAGTTNQTVQIYCDSEAMLLNNSGDFIMADSVEISATPVAAGQGRPCNGMSSAAMSHAINGANTIYIGATLDASASGAFEGGSYSTAISGGDNIQIDVYYQ
jgi:hypothetical protein